MNTEAFFVVVYGAEEEDGHPETSHCFATFARIAEEPGTAPEIELHHINWFSPRGHETGVPHGLATPGALSVSPERGENRTTREALLLARRRELRITRWGPYAIEKEFYGRALRHIDLLEGRVRGRRVLYKQLDGGFREPRIVALNCIHAVSDIDRDYGRLRTGLANGEDAARKIALHFRRWIKEDMRENSRAWERIWRQTWSPSAAPDDEIIRRGAQ